MDLLCRLIFAKPLHRIEYGYAVCNHRAWGVDDIGPKLDIGSVALKLVKLHIRTNGGELENLIKAFVQARSFQVVKKVCAHCFSELNVDLTGRWFVLQGISINSGCHI